VAGLNSSFAKDVYSFGLSYYGWEYQPINYQNNTFEANQWSSGAFMNSSSLFNGNIRAMQTTITHPETREVMPMITGYQYDQLNRLRFARSFENMNLAGNSWDYLETYDNRYFNEFVYDPNGNILTQKRHLRNGTQIEELTYQYKYNNNNLLIQNRLYHVNDVIGAGVDATDIDDMGAFTAGTNINTANNYSYDEEGRLTKDEQEGIDAITWRVDGKVKKIARPVGSGKKNVTFDYDAMGNRIAKHTYDDNWMLEKSTYYVLDAQGNQMNMYEHVVSESETQYNLVERNIYGSSRLGTFTENVNMLSENTSVTQLVVLGNKYYELSNHLGNVLTVIKDIKIPIELEQDDEPFEDPGDAPYFNADGTIKFDQLINHPSHTCVNPGLNFQDFPSSSYPTFEDVNGDGNLDMKVRSEVPIYAFPTRLFFYTTPGETYTLNFDMSNWENVLLAHVIPINCGAAVTNGTVWYTPGNHNISFTAVSAQTEIKWFIIKQQALLPGELTLSNVSFTQGTGPFFSQPLTPPVDPETDLSHYEVAIVSVADYSPFGVELDGRTFNSSECRRGYQGSEKDDEVKGSGNSYTTYFRQLDPRLGRWLSIDPVVQPWQSPYCSMDNNPILNNDVEGDKIRGNRRIYRRYRAQLALQIANATRGMAEAQLQQNGEKWAALNRYRQDLLNQQSALQSLRDSKVIFKIRRNNNFPSSKLSSRTDMDIDAYIGADQLSNRRKGKVHLIIHEDENVNVAQQITFQFYKKQFGIP
jgi:RHS repeat-associated protein